MIRFALGYLVTIRLGWIGIFDLCFCSFQGEMDITPACYAHLLNSLTGFAQGKVAVILEVSFAFFISYGCQCNEAAVYPVVYPKQIDEKRDSLILG